MIISQGCQVLATCSKIKNKNINQNLMQNHTVLSVPGRVKISVACVRIIKTGNEDCSKSCISPSIKKSYCFILFAVLHFVTLVFQKCLLDILFASFTCKLI